MHSAREPFLEELRPRFLLADGGRDLLAFLRHRGKQSLDRENNQYLLEVCLPENESKEEIVYNNLAINTFNYMIETDDTLKVSHLYSESLAYLRKK